jgi:heptosyltransferase-2/heptosyltransferase-3
MPYWFNRSQRELVSALRQKQHRFVWVCETAAKSYRLLARAGITRANSITQLDLAPVAQEHYCDKWLRLGKLSPDGFDAPPLPAAEHGTELFVSEREREECLGWLRARGLDAAAPLVCIQAGSRRTTRRGRASRASNSKYWQERNWGELIDGIIASLPGAQVMLCGVAAEADMCQAIQQSCTGTNSVHNLARELPIRRLLALLSMAHSCISVDTGPAHVAAALNCPLVVLFGKASPQRFRPVSLASPVRVIQGVATSGQDPDIGHIGVQQVLDGWQEIGKAQ